MTSHSRDLRINHLVAANSRTSRPRQLQDFDVPWPERTLAAQVRLECGPIPIYTTHIADLRAGGEDSIGRRATQALGLQAARNFWALNNVKAVRGLRLVLELVEGRVFPYFRYTQKKM
jgi:hypothetical protein